MLDIAAVSQNDLTEERTVVVRISSKNNQVVLG